MVIESERPTVTGVLRMLLLAASAATLSLPSSAQPVGSLTVSAKNGEGQQVRVVLDLAALERMPQHTFSTNSPWTKEPQQYTGPLLRDVLALVKGSGSQIHATALNEYKITIPVEDARRFDVIVAHRINNKPIPIRDRGPYFVIYPFDQRPELQRADYYNRSIWQLKTILVE